MSRLLHRAPPTTAGYTTPEVSPHVFVGTICAMTALSFLFLPARFYARWKSMHRFSWDDFAVAFAWGLSLAITVAVVHYSDVIYQVMRIGAGLAPFPPNVRTITMEFTRLFAIILMVLYTGLWSVKLAFLLFFWKLGTRSICSLRRWWYVVASATAVCYVLCFATLPYRCTLVSFKITASKECSTQGLSFVSMGVNCALDVLTDCLIMSIPFLILRRIRISRRQKYALSAVFSLVVITIAFAIVRATITTVGVKRQIDPIWMYLWTSIELNVAVIVACVAPYRTLFIRYRDPRTHAQEPRPSLKKKAFRLFSVSSRLTEREQESCWSPEGLPYLAPWPSGGDVSGPGNKHDSHIDSCKTYCEKHHCQEPWMTADLPHLEPWYENETKRRISSTIYRDSLQLMPRAYIRSCKTEP